MKLRQATNGDEFLEYSETQTKTRTVENPRDIRQIAVPESERDLVVVYKLYAKKRPSEMYHDNAPINLAVNTSKNHDYSKPWFKKSAVGLNQLNSLLKTMAEKAGLEPNVKNHSGRKTMIQTLTNNEIPATHIIQLSVCEIIQWSQKNNKQKMSCTLTDLSTRTGSKNKTSSSQHAENSAIAVLSDDQQS